MSTRHLLEADLGPAAQCLGQAFVDNPVSRWLAGPDAPLMTGTWRDPRWPFVL